MTKKIIFFSYILITGITNYFHEPWRDETHTWLIARDLDLVELFNALIAEGAMPLWPLLLFLFAKIGLPFQSIFIANWGFSLAAAYLIIFKSQFNKITCISILLSSVMLYEYPVVARHYALSAFLLFLVVQLFPQRNLKRWTYHISLFLLTISNVFTLAISAILWIENITSIRKFNVRILAALLVGIGASSIFYLYGYNRVSFISNKITTCVFSNDLYWECLAKLTSFNSTPAVIFSPLIKLMFLLVLISFIILSNFNKKTVFIASLLLINVPWLFFICHVSYVNKCAWYHSGNLYIFIIAGIWLYTRLINGSLEIRKVLLMILIYSGLLTTPIGFRNIYLDYFKHFSPTMDMASYIKNNLPEEAIIATYLPVYSSGVLAYLPERKLFDITQEKYVTFHDYRISARSKKDIDSAFATFLKKSSIVNQPVYLLVGHPSFFELETQYLENVYFRRGYKENLFLYKLKKQ